MKYLLLIIFMTYVSFSVEKIEIFIKIEDDNNNETKLMTIGVHPNATYGLDYEIGEQDLPRLPPPDQLTSWLTFIDSTENRPIYSRVDFIPIPGDDEPKLTHRYIIDFVRIDDSDDEYFTWTKIDDKRITKATISDGYTIKADMLTEESFKMRGLTFINVVYVDIEYDFSINSVNDAKVPIFTYPNPVSEILNIDENIRYDKVEIFDLSGNKMFTYKFKDEVYLGSLSAGMYILKIYNNNIVIDIKNIIKY